jgi:glucokinase
VLTEAIVADIGGTNSRFGLGQSEREIDHVAVLTCASCYRRLVGISISSGSPKFSLVRIKGGEAR